ncbi:hypothetical protein D6856_13670 [Butyrivibrio sp. XB500-5]|uniref:sialate O-acetylesterase n=1 Tax=Butyrivibrio sp. XB500-5 TaxID=2364880 RepID=UPI000EAA51A4|nr:sialate O-acetylesterase [Butyrivibrio sp. XB500-5]RKM57704.1 hypothetical protein D6856_13670 [Butyrivibrio sp. XB500-5]
MARLILPRLLSDGCVLQRRKSIHIWGWDTPGVRVTAKLDGVVGNVEASDNGRFDIYLPAREGGGPYDLTVSDSEGDSITVKDVMIGIVWFCSGQSNMEFPGARVADKYPFLRTIEDEDMIRTFKIIEETSFSGPYEEHNTGSWVSVNKDTIMSFSIVAYFFAEKLRAMTHQAVGLINASLGGSRIQSWMSRQMLEGYDELIAETDKYNDAAFRNERAKWNEDKTNKWINDLYNKDLGIQNSWEKENTDDSDWDELSVPTMFTGTPLEGHVGSVWFRKKFDLPKELAGKSARLFLGTMVDSDETYINGEKVGVTEYQYPPRKYDIREGLTRQKDNTLVVRLKIELGLGRITPGAIKEYKIFNEDASAELDGIWKYKIGATCDKMPPTDFINWNSSGLYNAMTAPCHNFPVDGIIWYQGESNVGQPWDYADLTEKMIRGYRKLWKEDNLPFIAVQLPNFVIDLTEEENWGEFRLVQNKILDIPSTGLVVTMGLGEDNDLHPVTKKPVGERLALWAGHLKYGYIGEYCGPMAAAIKKVQDEKAAVLVELEHAQELKVSDEGKGTEIRDFFFVDKDGELHEADAEIKEGSIVVRSKDDVKNAVALRWCCENTYRGGLIVNAIGIPMCPFELPIE